MHSLGNLSTHHWIVNFVPKNVHLLYILRMGYIVEENYEKTSISKIFTFLSDSEGDLHKSSFTESGQVGYYSIENFIRNSFCFRHFSQKSIFSLKNRKNFKLVDVRAPPEAGRRVGEVNFL